MSRRVLWENGWIRVVEIDGWYTCTELCVDGRKTDGVLVIGLRMELSQPEFLVRMEHTPCHGEGLNLTSITGNIDEGETPGQAAVRELLEESGYSAQESRMKYLGWVYPSKASDYKQHLFAVDLTGLPQGDIVGDGTKGEEGAYSMWVKFDDAIGVRSGSYGNALFRAMSHPNFSKYAKWYSTYVR